MRYRLFQVDVFAGRQGPHRRHCVPVMGSGYDHGIDRIIVQDRAQVGRPSHWTTGAAQHQTGQLVPHCFVRIANGSNANAVLAHERFGELGPVPPTADYRHHHIGRRKTAPVQKTAAGADGSGRSGQQARFKESPSRPGCAHDTEK